jgi:hypothetical protein
MTEVKHMYADLCDETGTCGYGWNPRFSCGWCYAG